MSAGEPSSPPAHSRPSRYPSVSSPLPPIATLPSLPPEHHTYPPSPSTSRGDRSQRGVSSDSSDQEDEYCTEGEEEALNPGRKRRTEGEDSERRGEEGTVLLSKEEKRRRYWRDAAINMLLILTWYTFASILSVYNKWMFSPDHFHFPFPLFVTSIHMIVQFCLALFAMLCFPAMRPKEEPSWKDYAKKVTPTAVATSLDIGLSNLSLKTITLSFYTMCKSSSLVFVLLFAFLFRLERPRWSLVGIILIITAGVVMMVATETKFVLSGMLQVFAASALGGLRWSLTQMLLDRQKMGLTNPLAVLFHLCPVMFVTLASTSMIFEGWFTVFRSPFFASLGATLRTLPMIIAPGVLAFGMNLTEFKLIQRTSVVTLSVAGIFKEVVTIFIASVLFGDILTPINISGLVVTLLGIGLYNYLKYRQITNAVVPIDPHTGRPLERAEVAEQDADDLASRGQYGNVLDNTASLLLGSPRVPSYAASAGSASRDRSRPHSVSSGKRGERGPEEWELEGWDTSGIETTGNGFVIEGESDEESEEDAGRRGSGRGGRGS